MYVCRVLPPAVAVVAVAAGLGYAVPAAAAVSYDPRTKAGFAAAADLRAAFGWSDATLSERAAGLTFHHDFFTEDTYAVRCGAGPFPVRHQRDFGRFDLTAVVVREPRRGTAAPYGERGRLAGFRITGAYAGVSGTSAPPAAGRPCPDRPGAKITEVRLTSTTTGWSLTVDSGGTGKVLRSGTTQGRKGV